MKKDNYEKQRESRALSQKLEPDANRAKQQGWICTGGINAGGDSFRIFENSKTGETEQFDSKNEQACLANLGKR